MVEALCVIPLSSGNCLNIDLSHSIIVFIRGLRPHQGSRCVFETFLGLKMNWLIVGGLLKMKCFWQIILQTLRMMDTSCCCCCCILCFSSFSR